MRLTTIRLAAFAVLGLAMAANAQDISLPNVQFPEPGTFCGPLKVCTPDTVTRGG